MLRAAILTALGTLLLSPALAAQEQPDTGRVVDGRLVTDTFEIDHEWRADTLLLSLRTDLPDNTDLMVSVDRYYWRDAMSDTYSIPYLTADSHVGAWEDETRRVLINDNFWRDSLTAHQRQMARIEMPFKVREIGDSIHIDFVVPVVQDDPRFGERNADLVGAAVDTAGLRVVEEQIALHKPLGKAPPPSPWVPRTELKPGHSYVLSEEAPLVPAVEPKDPVAAAVATITLPSGAVVTVREVRSKDGTPWYRVEASAPSGRRVGEGWINSAALIGQAIRRVER